MSKEEVQSYRLNSTDEPSDEMLEYVMIQVREAAIISSQKAKEELQRRFSEMCMNIAKRKSSEI